MDNREFLINILVVLYSQYNLLLELGCDKQADLLLNYIYSLAQSYNINREKFIPDMEEFNKFNN